MEHLEEQEAVEEADNAKHEVERQVRLQNEEKLIRSGQVIVLGEQQDREWLFPQMQWEIKPKSQDEQRRCWLTRNNLLYHIAVCGATRAGKSTLIVRPTLRYCLQHKIPLIILDPKGDQLKAGDTSLNISMADAERRNSFRFCVIDHELPVTLAARNFSEAVIDDISPEGRFFVSWARRVLSAILLGHRIVFNRWPELIQVLEYAALPEHINSLVLRLKKIEEDSSVDPANRRTAREQTLELKNLANQVQHRSKTNPFETVANAIQRLGK